MVVDVSEDGVKVQPIAHVFAEYGRVYGASQPLHVEAHVRSELVVIEWLSVLSEANDAECSFKRFLDDGSNEDGISVDVVADVLPDGLRDDRCFVIDGDVVFPPLRHHGQSLPKRYGRASRSLLVPILRCLFSFREIGFYSWFFFLLCIKSYASAISLMALARCMLSGILGSRCISSDRDLMLSLIAFSICFLIVILRCLQF